MTDLLLKASDITVTHNGVKEYADGSHFGTIEFVADGEFGDVEVEYTIEYANPVQCDYQKDWFYHDGISVTFTHFAPALDDEEVEDENEEALKTAISQYIISQL